MIEVSYVVSYSSMCRLGHSFYSKEQKVGLLLRNKGCLDIAQCPLVQGTNNAHHEHSQHRVRSAA
jgi:hypothetical protein